MYDVSKNTPLSIYKEVSQPAMAPDQADPLFFNNIVNQVKADWFKSGVSPEDIGEVEYEEWEGTHFICLGDCFRAEWDEEAGTLTINEEPDSNIKTHAIGVTPNQLSLVAYGIRFEAEDFQKEIKKISEEKFVALEKALPFFSKAS